MAVKIHSTQNKLDAHNTPLKDAFQKWLQLEYLLGDLCYEPSEEKAMIADHIIEEQSLLMKSIFNIASTSYDDLLLKVAIWRYEEPDIHPPQQQAHEKNY